MPIGSAKIGVLGAGLVPGGTATFNASGTFTVPPGVKKVSITGKGGTGNPGNAGNPGNSGNPGSGGSGAAGGLAYRACSNSQNFSPTGTAGGGAWKISNQGRQGSLFNGPYQPLNSANCWVVFGGSNPEQGYPTGRGGSSGQSGNAGNAGSAGNPGNTGTASTGLNYNFAGGAGGSGGAAGAAGNGGSGGTGGNAGNDGGNSAAGNGGCGGNGGGSGGQGASVPGGPSGSVAWGSKGGAGAGAVNNGASGNTTNVGNDLNWSVGGTGNVTAPTPQPGNPCRANYPCLNPSSQGGYGGRYASPGIISINLAISQSLGTNIIGRAPYNNGWGPCAISTRNSVNSFSPAPAAPEIFRSGGGGGGGALISVPLNNEIGRGGGGGGGGGRGNAGNAGGTSPTPSGSAANPSTFNCVPVTPGSPYPIVVGAPGGQVVISWNPQ